MLTLLTRVISLAHNLVCQGETFTFKLDQALADNDGIYLVIEATEGQSNGVFRAHSIKIVEEFTDAAIDIHAYHVAKNGAPNASARRSSSATTTSTPAPAKSPAPCWQKSSGPLQRPVAASRSLRY